MQGLGNKVFGKLATIPMNDYPITVRRAPLACVDKTEYNGRLRSPPPLLSFTTQLNILITACYLPTSLCYIIPAIRMGKISARERAIPQRVWCTMGALDSIAGIMQTFATTYITSGALIVMLSQSAIPISMIISKLFLRTKYAVYHYCGAVVVCCGLAVVLVPQFLQPSPGSHNEGLWVAVMILSCIPMSFSSVYKERSLGDDDVDVIYLNYWVAVYQLAFSIPLSIPAGYATNVPAQHLWRNFLDGLKCYTGKGTDCAMAPIYVNMYVAFNLAFNVVLILILKVGSANILFLALTALVPLANVVFAIPGVPAGGKVRPTDAVGLVVILSGLCAYRFYPSLRVLVYKKILHKPLPEADGNDEGMEDDDDVTQSLLASPTEPVEIVDESSLNRAVAQVPGRSSLRAQNALETAFATGAVDARMARSRELRKRISRDRRDPAKVRSGYLSRLGLTPGSPPARTSATPLYNSMT